MQEKYVCRQCKDWVASCRHVLLQQQDIHTASTVLCLLMHLRGQLLLASQMLHVVRIISTVSLDFSAKPFDMLPALHFANSTVLI